MLMSSPRFISSMRLTWNLLTPLQATRAGPSCSRGPALSSNLLPLEETYKAKSRPIKRLAAETALVALCPLKLCLPSQAFNVERQSKSRSTCCGLGGNSRMPRLMPRVVAIAVATHPHPPPSLPPDRHAVSLPPCTSESGAPLGGGYSW